MLFLTFLVLIVVLKSEPVHRETTASFGTQQLFTQVPHTFPLSIFALNELEFQPQPDSFLAPLNLPIHPLFALFLAAIIPRFDRVLRTPSPSWRMDRSLIEILGIERHSG